MAEEASSSPRNEACLVDCYGKGGRTVAAELLSELVGGAVEPREDHAVWRVDNKYYCADVHFTVCSGGCEVGTQWEAVLMLCDLSRPDTFEEACKTWEGIAGASSPSVCLLVGTMHPEGEQSCHQKALEWCVGKGIELVEWVRGGGGEGGGGGGEGKEEEEEEEEDDFPERVGVERVSEALQAHMWSHMTMKRQERRVPRTTPPADGEPDAGIQPAPNSSMGEDATSDLAETKSKVTKPVTSQDRIDHLLSMDDEELLAQGLSDDQDPGGESFESLFARFAQMKAHADTLPHEERKQYAEKVVMSFWKAIGGNDEEVRTDSDSDS